MINKSWSDITPEVNSSAEFFEIVNDFGNPLELVREAISNSIDWKATYVKISFDVETIDGFRRSVIKISDNGQGMDRNVLSQSFWGLGYSQSRLLKESGQDFIGEKGHGTKIYLRSEKVIVRTKTVDCCLESSCDSPFQALSRGELHKPQIRDIDPNELEIQDTGTEIIIIGYNDNERSNFIQDIVRDYIKWFTKIGSIEKMFDISKHNDFKVYLKCLDVNIQEEISFGHVFPDENSNIEMLFKEHDFDAAEYYVKRFIEKSHRLKNYPEVTFDLIVSVEGDKIKRQYNRMIQERSRKETGRYKVSDRYGIWICKDYIPISQINDWISGFGTGSNSLTMIHGFVNCQGLKLTANRGAVSNTDPLIQNELKEEIQKIFDEIDLHLRDKGVYTLRQWQNESKTIKQETSEFKSRINSIKKRNKCEHNGRVFLEPKNESELFGLFTSIYSLDLFQNNFPIFSDISQYLAICYHLLLKILMFRQGVRIDFFGSAPLSRSGVQ